MHIYIYICEYAHLYMHKNIYTYLPPPTHTPTARPKKWTASSARLKLASCGICSPNLPGAQAMFHYLDLSTVQSLTLSISSFQSFNRGVSHSVDLAVINIENSQFLNISIFQSFGLQIFKPFNLSIVQSFNLSVFQSLHLSISLSFNLSIFRRLTVSVNVRKRQLSICERFKDRKIERLGD